MARILINYQSENLRYAVSELYEHDLYSWRALGNDFARKTAPKLDTTIVKNIDIYDTDRSIVADKIKEFIDKNAIDIIFPLYNDMMFSHLYNILGFTERQCEILSDKSKYTALAKSIGILVPNTYTDIKDARYPIIAKPVNGTGSIGIKVLNDYSDYFFFASGEDIQYNDLGKYYIYQDFLNGTTVSSAGRIIDGEVIVDCSYNIEMSELPYRAETGFVFAPNPDIDTILKYHIQKLASKLELDTCAWMADFIYSDGRFFLVDFSPRLSVSAQVIIKYSAGIDYTNLVVESILNKDKSRINCKKCVCYRYFDFPKGEYEVEFTGDQKIADELELPKEVSYLNRMDMLMPFKGYAVTSATYLSAAEGKWQSIADNIVLRNKTKVT